MGRRFAGRGLDQRRRVWPSVSVDPGLQFITDNAAIWLESDTGVTTTPSKVSYWTNQGSYGSALDFDQVTDANRPTYNSSDANFNGQPSFTFLYTSSLYLEAFGTLPTAPTSADLFVVAKGANDPAAATTDMGLHQFSGSSSGSFTPFTDGNIYLQMLRSSGSQSAGNPTLDMTTRYIYNHCMVQGTSQDLWLNNSSQYSDATGVSPLTWSDPAYIGRSASSGLRYWSGEIAAFIFFDSALGATDRNNVFAYLNNKYAGGAL